MSELLNVLEKVDPARLKIMFIRLVRMLCTDQMEEIRIVHCKYCGKVIAEKNNVGRCIIQCRHCKVKNIFEEEDHTTEYREI